MPCRGSEGSGRMLSRWYETITTAVLGAPWSDKAKGSPGDCRRSHDHRVSSALQSPPSSTLGGLGSIRYGSGGFASFVFGGCSSPLCSRSELIPHLYEYYYCCGALQYNTHQIPQRQRTHTTTIATTSHQEQQASAAAAAAAAWRIYWW